MLTKNDLVLLLTEMQNENINVDNYLKKLMLNEGISSDVLKFINTSRELDVSKFYELIRKEKK